MELRVCVPGKPQTKQRPRVTRKGTFTPKATRDWDARATRIIDEAMEAQGWTAPPRGEGVVAVVTVVFARKTSQPGEGGRIRHTRRPDLDNIIKCVKDALGKGALTDDAQIWQMAAEKWYASHGESPHVEVVLRRTS